MKCSKVRLHFARVDADSVVTNATGLLLGKVGTCEICQNIQQKCSEAELQSFRLPSL